MSLKNIQHSAKFAKKALQAETDFFFTIGDFMWKFMNGNVTFARLLYQAKKT